jgi:asparagine N-glycosylation enzyme membrane subunit Stt3
MTKGERSSAGADVRTVLQAALLVLGTGMTLLDGWVLGGIGGVVGAVFAAVIFLVSYYAITKDSESTNGRVIGLAVCVAVTLIVFLSVTL